MVVGVLLGRLLGVKVGSGVGAAVGDSVETVYPCDAKSSTVTACVSFAPSAMDAVAIIEDNCPLSVAL